MFNEFFSLEYRLMKTLQSKSSSAVDNNNVVTISTGSSAMRLNNNKNNNGSSSSGGGGSSTDDFVGKQRITSTITSVAPKVMTTSNGTSTINLSGPVTDL